MISSLVAALSLMLIATPAHAQTLEVDVTPSAEVTSAPVDAEPIMAELPTYEPTDLIRGESLPGVYYYGQDGLRYVFPNEATYFTWYENFDDVIWISDSELASIQIGGNVTYKPGVRMVKIQSDPTTYAVGQHGVIHPIASEAIAMELYGENWNQQIDDVPDYLFSNYTYGSDITLASEYDPQAHQADAYSIQSDKQLKAFVQIDITEDGFEAPTETVQAGTPVRWLNNTSEAHSATEWDRNWGSGTLNPMDHYTRVFTQIGEWHYYSSYGDRNTFEGALIVE